jgi:cytochrome d ubiquinol oxidase subunit I
VTEGGRQPWIVYGKMTVAEAATKSGGLGWSVLVTILIYLGLAAALVLILRKLATGAPPELAEPAAGDDPAPTGPQGRRTEEATA